MIIKDQISLLEFPHYVRQQDNVVTKPSVEMLNFNEKTLTFGTHPFL